VNALNMAADAAPDVLRVSMDATATVKSGPFARGGKSRVPVQAADHDVQAEATVTPVGLFLPQTAELFIYHVTSKVTSDCLVDRLEQWWEAQRVRFGHITTLVVLATYCIRATNSIICRTDTISSQDSVDPGDFD